MFSKPKYEAELAAWSRGIERLRQRSLVLSKRLRKVRELAQPGCASIAAPARRLALKKVARLHPTLQAKVDAIKLAQQQTTKTKLREQLAVNVLQESILIPRRR
jgi:hypothetical protein